MIVVSWNVNSLGARMPRVLELLAELRPDVVCLQETKARPDGFPHLELQMAGYTALEHSSGGRNGVALLVRNDLAPRDVVTGLPGEPLPEEARWIEAEVDGVRVISVYVPNGRSLDDATFPDKLRFLERMTDRVRALGDTPLVVAGDFNVAPSDLDVYDPVRFVGSTHTSARERELLGRLTDLGLRDVHRHLRPDEQRFTWWDYRGGNFHKNLGMRIDLFLVSQGLVTDQTGYDVARTYRKGPRPSDHAPIVLSIG